MDYLLHHLLRTSTDRFPEKEALVDRGRRLNYTEVWTQTGGLAAALRETGLQRSDRVGIFLDPCIEQPLSIFAVSRADCAFVPIHHSLFPAQVQHIAADCGMKVLITDQRKLDRLQEYLPQLPALQHLIVVDGRDTVDCLLPVTDFATACEQCAEKQPPVCIEKDLAAIIYTSGSTGKPKGVMLSHTNIIAGASIVSEYLNITRNDRLLAALPFSFDAGLNQLTTAIQQGATCVMIKFLLAREVVNTLESEKITGLAGVPPLWGLLAQPSSTLAARELPELRYITNTGGALPQHVLQALRQAQPNTHVFLMYGLTEAFRSTYLSPSELDRRTNSIGRAIPNTEILVINERGEQCGPGESGELVHHGPTVSLGYWGQPELTNQVLRPHPFPPAGSVEPPKVCYSGDIVRMDEDGYLYFAGRRDNLLKTSGFRVSPNEVEAQLCDSGKLRDAAVVGVPDDVLGQRIVAYVTAAEGSDIDPAELLAWSATQMPRYMVPARVEVLEALPRTASGKIDYPSLRMRACNAAETAGVAQVTA